MPNLVVPETVWGPRSFGLNDLRYAQAQAAYAAPLILLAQTRQADRDKAHSDSIEKLHDQQTKSGDRRERQIEDAITDLRDLLQANTTLTRQDKELTEQVAALTREIHAHVTQPG